MLKYQIIYNLYQEQRFSAITLKWIAIAAMVVDHIGWIYFSDYTFTTQSMHFIGRLTAPLMCFFLVEGFYLSSNINKYLSRLFIFAIVSQIPFTLISYTVYEVIAQPELIFNKLNFLFNLFMALICLLIVKSKYSKTFKFIIVCALLFISNFADWGSFIIIFTLVLSSFRYERAKQASMYIVTAMSMLILLDLGIVSGMPVLIMAWFPIGILLAPLFWIKYNGKRGREVGGRYFFYLFYPVHILILALLADYFQLRA